MNIAIDLDGTFAADKVLFHSFALAARQNGHTVYCITARPESDREEVTKILKNCMDAIYLTGYRQKEEYMEERGVIVDIWIDDNPHTITNAKKVRDNVKAYKKWAKDNGLDAI